MASEKTPQDWGELCLEYEQRIADLEAKLAEVEEQAKHYPQVAGENIQLREKLAEAEARTKLAVEALECCPSCVRTWLVGELDAEQMERVHSAIDAAREESE